MGSIQPYKDSYNEELVLYQAQISPEEAAKREKDAEELDKKLRHIVEDLPDREYKRMGSMAGANSRTFDTYRRDKRREQERLKMLEQEEREEERKRKFQESMETKNQIEDAKTAARRAKRLKQKEKQKMKRNKKCNKQPE